TVTGNSSWVTCARIAANGRRRKTSLYAKCFLTGTATPTSPSAWVARRMRSRCVLASSACATASVTPARKRITFATTGEKFLLAGLRSDSGEQLVRYRRRRTTWACHVTVKGAPILRRGNWPGRLDWTPEQRGVCVRKASSRPSAYTWARNRSGLLPPTMTRHGAAKTQG